MGRCGWLPSVLSPPTSGTVGCILSHLLKVFAGSLPTCSCPPAAPANIGGTSFTSVFRGRKSVRIFGPPLTSTLRVRGRGLLAVPVWKVQ